MRMTRMVLKERRLGSEAKDDKEEWWGGAILPHPYPSPGRGERGPEEGSAPFRCRAVNCVFDAGGGKRVATGNATGLYFIHGDQLGSTRLVTSIRGTVVTQMLFKAWGTVRWWTGALETDYRFAGQRQDSNA